jgi:hypothetical protein
MSDTLGSNSYDLDTMTTGRHLPMLQNTNKYLSFFHPEDGDCMFLPDLGKYLNIPGDNNLQGTKRHTQLAKRFCNSILPFPNHYQLTTYNYLNVLHQKLQLSQGAQSYYMDLETST